MFDAAWVFNGLFRGRTMWPYICVYWLLLTVKNMIDWWGSFE